MMERKKHIVFIVGNYYPNYSANGICIKKVIDVLKGTHIITIISIKTQKEHLNIEEYDSIRIIRIETSEYRIRNYINSILKKSNSISKKAFGIALLRAVQVSRYLNAIISKENIINALVKEYTKALYDIKAPIDLIIPVCIPFESIVAALKYKVLYNSSVKIIPYLFDQFSASNAVHRTKWNKKLKMQRHLILEKTMLKKSDLIIATYDWEGHLKQYFNEYSEKIKYVEIPALCLIEKTDLIQYDERNVHIVYTGALDYRIRPPEYTLKLISSCITEKSEYILHLYAGGNCNKIIKKYMKKNPENIIDHGIISVEMAHSALTNADVLLSIGNIDTTQTPSKIYEYIACGKPIIHLYNDENDPTISILKKYDRTCCLNQKEMSIESNRIKMINFIEKYKKTQIIAYEKVKSKFIEATPEYTAQVLNIILLNPSQI